MTTASSQDEEKEDDRPRTSDRPQVKQENDDHDERQKRRSTATTRPRNEKTTDDRPNIEDHGARHTEDSGAYTADQFRDSSQATRARTWTRGRVSEWTPPDRQETRTMLMLSVLPADLTVTQLTVQWE